VNRLLDELNMPPFPLRFLLFAGSLFSSLTPSIGVIPRDVRRIRRSLLLRKKNQIETPTRTMNTIVPIVAPTIIGTFDGADEVAALDDPAPVG
jgi:hypothetical protein